MSNSNHQDRREITDAAFEIHMTGLALKGIGQLVATDGAGYMETPPANREEIAAIFVAMGSLIQLQVKTLEKAACIQ